MDPADLVVTAAVVGAGGLIADIAVRGDRIVAVGEGVGELIGPRTRRIDVPDGLVLPGFQDAHVHAPPAGRERLHVDLHDLPGRRAYLDAVAAYAAARPDVDWIVGGGWAMEHFPNGLPHKDDLDAVSPDRPVFLFNRDVHGAWVNSAALRAAAIDRDTPDPSDGRIERDPLTGEPTGALHEGAAYHLHDHLVPSPSIAEWQEAILTAQSHLHSLGITGWQDAWVTPDTLTAYRALAGDGRLTARVRAALWWDRHRGLEQIDDFRQQRATSDEHAAFRPRTVKIMLDGVVENGTAALIEPYCGGCHGDGDLGLTYVEPDVLDAAVTELDLDGFQVHLHAIGDRAVRMGLDAIAAARRANGRRDNRHHIAHVQIVQPDDLRRFAELDVVANCQAFWAQSEPQMDELTIPVIGRDRAELQYPFADFRRAGVRLAMGSDWPVTTADPLQQIEVAVRRTDPARRSTSPFLPEQSLSVADAVTAFTAGSAWVNHDEDGGRLQVGARADLVVLDRDILTGPADEIADARVVATVAGGDVVHG